MPLDYRTMSLAEIVDDLSETLADLVVNAGESHLQPQLEMLGDIESPRGRTPSTKLVTIMEELYTFDADLLAPRAQQLMRDVVVEIRSLYDNAA